MSENDEKRYNLEEEKDRERQFSSKDEDIIEKTVKNFVEEVDDWSILNDIDPELHREIALKLIEHERGVAVAFHFDKFNFPDSYEIILKLIKKGDAPQLALTQYKGKLFDKRVALKLLEDGEKKFVGGFLSLFRGLDEEVALKLIEMGYGPKVVDRLDVFKDINYQKIAIELIKNGDGWNVAHFLNKFQGIDCQKIALELINDRSVTALCANLNMFQGLDQNIAEKLIELGDGKFVIKNLDKFKELNNEFALTLIKNGDGTVVLKNLSSFKNLQNEEISSALFQYLGMKQFLTLIDDIPHDYLEFLEKKHFILSYQSDLNLPAIGIYQKYVELKKQGDEMQITGFIEKIKQQGDSLISSEKQSPEMTKMENYQELIEAVYPNHAENWTNFENNESCPDRSDDLKSFKIRDKYEVDLLEGVEMVLKPGKEKDEKALSELEKPIAEIQQKFSQVGFEKEKMFNILDQEIEQKISSLSHQEIFKTREEKLYGLLLESLVNKFNPEELKELLIAYQFAEFEDIRSYLEGTRAQAEQAKNPDYAYLLELREFFADRIKEVQRKIVQKAQENPEITKILPEYYQEKRNQEKEKSKKEQLDRLRVKDLGLDGNLLERILKELSKKTDKKGEQFNLVKEDEKGNIVLDKKGQGIAGMIFTEQKKAVKTIETITGEKVDPGSIHLGELNLQEYLKAEQMMQKGEYDEELFSRYVLQAFQGIFEKELTAIDKEVAKYQPKEEIGKGKKQKKLECFITKNHTSAHARATGGVCVSGDNPKKQGEECQWNMPNYFQLILRDSETKVCQGLVLLHYYEDKGKKILTAAFDPCSTYLYQVDEKQLFKGLLKQLETFTQDNDIDIIAVSQNKAMRTNRTGGEFEKAMDNQIRNLNQIYSLDEEQIFSYNPKYTQKNLDVVWVKK